MSEILSNVEIEALLDMFRAEQAHIETVRAEDLGRVVAADGGGGSSGPLVSRIDLCKPNRLSREQIGALEHCAGSAARAIGATAGEKLRVDMVCDCVGVEQQRFGTLMSQLSGSVALYVLRLPPLAHTAVLSMSTELLYAAVDRILGGSGRVSNVPPELTAAEYTVADAFVGPCLDHICRSFEAFGDVTWDVESRLSNPSAVQILGTHEVAVSMYFQLAGEFMHGDMRLILPHAMLEPHLGGLARSRVGAFNLEPGTMRDTVAGTMRGVDVDLCVRLGESSLSVRDLMSLQIGDVVPIDTAVGDLLVAPVEGVPKFTGTVGTRGRRLAYRIESRIN